MNRHGNVITWSGEDIADALGMARNVPCANCRHGLYDHNHGKSARFDLIDLGTCTEWDRRTTTGYCKCERFVEAARG